jgi:hypothetical protein
VSPAALLAGIEDEAPWLGHSVLFPQFHNGNSPSPVRLCLFLYLISVWLSFGLGPSVFPLKAQVFTNQISWSISCRTNFDPIGLDCLTRPKSFRVTCFDYFLGRIYSVTASSATFSEESVVSGVSFIISIVVST